MHALRSCHELVDLAKTPHMIGSIAFGLSMLREVVFNVLVQ